MDLRHIRYFITAAEELNITRAAEKLHLSQPPLSRALMELEDELGCVLFIRGKRHLTLTAEGLAFKRRGEQLLTLVDMTKAEISEMQNGISGTLYIGHVDSNGPTLVAEWIESFKKLYPNVTYNLWCGNVDDLTDRLKAGLIDLAITMTPTNTDLLDGFKVFSENWVAIIPANDPLGKSKKEYITLEELIDNDLIISSRRSRETEIRSWFKDFKKQPRFIVKTAHSSNAAKLVTRELGIALFPASVAKNISSGANVTIKEITPSINVDYLLSWDNERHPNALATKFITHIKEMYAVSES
ncbi:LysR family transcriptional regulator [Succinimonas sp.]|uniref:LysR family transcriptional regulator n=1 Tax=Succinimonas sp. TaxID=1936151 RepID=UPI002E838FEF|nr:LysR family transcriptional regulator [Succinimonas sp.]MEE3422448.1 LysR family transcriptional regulator [Succinimonas sp.]